MGVHREQQQENMDTLVIKPSPKKPFILPRTALSVKQEPGSVQYIKDTSDFGIKLKTESPQKVAAVSSTTSPLKELKNRPPPLDISKLKCPLQKSHGPSNSRRNTRERNRMKVINTTFVTLQKHLPSHYFSQKKSNKISKVDILRSAINYINMLQDIVSSTEVPPYAQSSVCSSDYVHPAVDMLSQCSAPYLQHLADCIAGPTGLPTSSHLTAQMTPAIGGPIAYADSLAYQVFSPSESSGHVASPLSSDSPSLAPSTPCDDRTLEYCEWA